MVLVKGKIDDWFLREDGAIIGPTSLADANSGLEIVLMLRGLQ